MCDASAVDLRPATAAELPFLQPGPELVDVPRMGPLDLNSLRGYPRILSAYLVPSLTRIEERLFVFGLVTSRRPERVLEIGFRFGGMSFLMLSAMQDTGRGQLVSIDPSPSAALDFSQFGESFHLVTGNSPAALAEAGRILGGPVDLAFVDGDHVRAAVAADLQGVFPLMAPGGYILLHDAFTPDVRESTEEFLASKTGVVVDCGFVCPWHNEQGWSGLRLLRVEG